MLPVGYIFLFFQGMGLDNDALMKNRPEYCQVNRIDTFQF